MRWIIESNRWKHLVGIAIVAIATFVMMFVIYATTSWQTFVVAVYVSLAVAAAMEFKDVHHANGDKPILEWDWSAWDWLDITAGILGYAVAAVLWTGVSLI